MTKIAIISDFNTANLAGLINNDAGDPKLEALDVPFGQVVQLLVDANQDVWQQTPDVALAWTQPQGVIESFQRMLDGEIVSTDDLLADVDAYADLLLMAAERVRTLLVATWVLPSYMRGAGLLEMRPGVGLAQAVMRMNLRLSERLEAAGNAYMLNAQPWMESGRRSAYNPKLWYMGKIAFSNDVFKAAVGEIKAALSALGGGRKKLIVLDLDNTMWGGVVGDLGWEHVQLGGHDAVGEAFVDFQRTVKALTKRGIVLAIASKNTEEVALEAIRKHPEMVLREEDFVTWRINWQDKAQNIADMVADLNLGLQSVVFIDDNPTERARVREALPEVYVPEWPEDRLTYKEAFLALTCFDTPTISAEDAQRTEMYRSENQRKQAKQSVGSLDEWLATLDIVVEIEALNDSNLPRTAQLLNKTNQLNLTTRRMADSELVEWTEAEGHALWTFRVSDKFGDAGLTGIMSVAQQGERLQIVDYILSCRVMGRKVEETIVAKAVEYAQQQGATEVYAEYLQTKKNKPTLDFFLRSGLAYDEASQTFTWDASQTYPYPPQITVKQDALTPEGAD